MPIFGSIVGKGVHVGVRVDVDVNVGVNVWVGGTVVCVGNGLGVCTMFGVTVGRIV